MSDNVYYVKSNIFGKIPFVRAEITSLLFLEKYLSVNLSRRI
jgi:hypothetical protein